MKSALIVQISQPTHKRMMQISESKAWPEGANILEAMYECVYVPEAVYDETSENPESIYKINIDNAIQQEMR